MTVFNMFTNHIDRAINKIGAEGKAIDLDIKFNQDLKIIKMRPNQKRVFENYPSEQYFSMIEPMGAGKSMTLKYLGTKLLEDNEDLKIIIVVPRTLIANTFKKETLEYPNGTIRKWDIGKNLCDEHYDKLDILVSFLKKTKFPKGIHSRVCVTTHLAFSMLQDKVGHIGDSFNNTLIIIDEAHHILCSEYDQVQISNQIGGIVYKILKRNHKSTSLWLVSATLFRGDRGDIIPPNMYDMFTEHFLPFDQHWKENIEYIETFEYNFVIYKDIMKDIQEIVGRNKEKTIIFCPYNGHLLKGRDKFQFGNELHQKIKEVWPDYQRLDLIDPDGREKRKKELETEKNASKIDIIYALKLFDEGTDWKYASQGIDAAPRNSLVIQTQKLGRILRDLKGKKHVSYYIFFPNQDVFETEQDMVIHLKKMFAIMAGAMILREAIQPLPYPQLPEPKEVSPFEEAVPNPKNRQDIIQKISEELVSYASENPNPTPTETREKIKEVLKEEFNIDDDEDYSITTHIGLMLNQLGKSQSPIINNIPQPDWKLSMNIDWMVEAGFDKIFDKSIYDTLLMFGTAAAGVETFDEFREIFNSKKKQPTYWVRIANELSEKNDGILYHDTYLKDNGLSGLLSAMYRHPELFSHIIQEVIPTSGEQWVKIAEHLERTHGKLPCDSYLRVNTIIFESESGLRKIYNLKNLANYIFKHQDMFKHIKQDKKNKPVKQHVKDAEHIEKTHGILPHNAKLSPALRSCIEKHPDEFKHINQEIVIHPVKNSDCKYQREVAQELADGNNGLIPKCNWLINNGYGYVDLAIRTNPNAFQGMKQEYGEKNQIRILGEDKLIGGIDIEYPKICDNLIAKHGAIPNTVEMKLLGLKHITSHMYKHPELYKGKPRYYTKWNKIRIIGE